MWTAWARRDTVKVTWLTYWSTLFSFQENGNMLDFSHRNRPIMAPFAWGCKLFALFLQCLQFSVRAHSKFGIMNYWKLRWQDIWDEDQSGAEGNADVRLRNMALVNRCSKMGEAGPICTQGCCYCCLNWKVDYSHLKDESQSKKKNPKRQLRKHTVLLNQLVSHYAQQQMLLHYLEYGCIFEPGMKARHKPEFEVYLTLECTHALI